MNKTSLGTSTDNSLSIAAQEFVWADSKVPEAHNYLISLMVKVLRESCARTVLDLGCGNGACSAVLQSRGFAVTGCDASVSGIAFARQAHPAINFSNMIFHARCPPTAWDLTRQWFRSKLWSTFSSRGI